MYKYYFYKTKCQTGSSAFLFRKKICFLSLQTCNDVSISAIQNLLFAKPESAKFHEHALNGLNLMILRHVMSLSLNELICVSLSK